MKWQSRGFEQIHQAPENRLPKRVGPRPTWCCRPPTLKQYLKANPMTDDTKIETERLKLRSWRGNDIKPYAKACNTRSVMRWLGGVQTPAEVKADVRYFVESEAKDGLTYWVVERLADDAFLGFCGLVRIPDHDCPIVGEWEIGWRLGQSFWREGFGHEAACAILFLAFDNFWIDTVYSRTAAGNKASRALMTKLGFERCPELDYVPAGESAKLLVYSMSRWKWYERFRSACAMKKPRKIAPHSVIDSLTNSEPSTTYEWMTKEQAENFAAEFESEERIERARQEASRSGNGEPGGGLSKITSCNDRT